MPLVRLTLFQDPVEVPEDEIPSLRAQGLLAEDTPTETPKAAAKTTTRKDAQS